MLENLQLILGQQEPPLTVSETSRADHANFMDIVRPNNNYLDGVEIFAASLLVGIVFSRINLRFNRPNLKVVK